MGWVRPQATRAPGLGADDVPFPFPSGAGEVGRGAAAQRWELSGDAHCGDLGRPEPGQPVHWPQRPGMTGEDGVVCCHSSWQRLV